MKWGPASAGRMALWHSSHQKCLWQDEQPNMFLHSPNTSSSRSSYSRPPRCVRLQVQRIQCCSRQLHLILNASKLRRDGPYLTIIITTHNRDSSEQHFRLSHFIKNMAAHSHKYNLKHQVELILVDYNSDPELPPLWEVNTMRWPPQREDMPLVRVITVPNHVHKASGGEQLRLH